MGNVDLTQLRNRASGLFEGFTRGQKTMLVVAISAAALGALVFLKWAAAPSWSPLYSGLPASEAASVTRELETMGVTYRMEGGDTIMVPQDVVYKTRLDLSAKGLPADGAPGYDLLDNQGITTSEFKQRVDYQRALEGELVRTIKAIDGVETASIHLVLPEKDLFTDDAVRPTASVLVQTRSGASLTSGQVQSIVHLVASSVEGLQATDVTVADQTGKMLAAPGEDGMSAAAGDARSGQTASFENGLAGSLQELITPLTGPGHARVQVSADLDFDKRKTTSESFSKPDESPVASESTTNETYTGAGGAVGGVLGPDATPITGGSGPGTDYKKEAANRSFAVGKVTEQVESAPGEVKRLSVAVLLDDSTAVKISDVRSLVSAAAGIDTARGDQLEVTKMAFDDSALPETPGLTGGSDSGSPIISLARVLGIVGIVALVLLLAYRSARRSSIARYPLAIALDPPAIGDGTRDAGSLDASRDRALPPVVEDDGIHVQAQIGNLIDRQPDEVAQVLRGWLADRRS